MDSTAKNVPVIQTEPRTVQAPTSSMTKSSEPFTMIIPRCCREGLDSCTHVPKKQRKTKNNIGL